MAGEGSPQQKLFELVGQNSWYHGLSSKADITPLLTDVGDWLMRAVDSLTANTITASSSTTTLLPPSTSVAPQMELVLSVMVDNPLRVFNFHLAVNDEAKTLRISSSKKHFPEFASLAELVKHYEDNDLPGGYRLKRSIPRPSWMISHALLSYQANSNVLGEGNFCTVVKGQYSPGNGAATLNVALKIWHEKSEVDTETRRKARDSMMKEARLITSYMHENIVQSFGVACDFPPVVIVMELCPGGCLEHHLQKQGDAISTAERIVYCLDVAKGVRYLHCKNCIHRDIACRNCVISSHGNIKIADFGLSKLLEDLASSEVTIKRGEQLPVRWMAPETLCRTPQFSKKSDVWSYGILCFEVFNNGGKPWPDIDGKTIAKNYRNGVIPEIPAACPGKVSRLIRKMTRLKAESRPDFGKITFLLKRFLQSTEQQPVESFTLNSLQGVMRCPNACSVSETMPTSIDEMSTEVTRSSSSTRHALNSLDTSTSSHRRPRSRAIMLGGGNGVSACSQESMSSSRRSFRRIRNKMSRLESSMRHIRGKRSPSDAQQGETATSLSGHTPSRTLQSILEGK